MENFRVSFMGLGYVGLVTSACFASRGIKTIGFDVDQNVVELVRQGQTPIIETGLDELIHTNVVRGFLRATVDPNQAILNTDITFLTVGTPNREDGSIDLTAMKAASNMVGKSLLEKNEWHLIVVKSTVTPTTTERVVKASIEEASHKSIGHDFGLCMNPEFLMEGSAIRDTFEADRVIIGEADPRSGDTLEQLYRQFYGSNTPPIIRTNIVNAELTKYSNNAFLAMKISFINQIANVCQKIPRADIETVANCIGLDRRIGPLFLKAGLGWGGSCFPKDLLAFLNYSKSLGVPVSLIKATLSVNESQPLIAVQFAKKFLTNLKDRRIAILGLSFKPRTDDMRNAVSIQIIKELLTNGARVAVYDPVAMENAKRLFGNKVEYCKSALDCIRNSDCSIIVTEWPEFSAIKPEDFICRMRNPIVIDGRRIYDPKQYAPKLKYVAIGLGRH